MRNGTVFFTSESVTEGHPDKICDQISDAVLDAALQMDPNARVACESFVTTDFVLVGGEMTVPRFLDVEGIARRVVKEIGYNDMRMGFDYNTFRFQNLLHEQSPDISQGVTEGQGEHQEQGAGDQGVMFGYACRETPELMPLPISLAHRITERMAEARKSGAVPFLRPDGKAQVTVEYREGKPVRVDCVVVAAQHNEEVDKHTLELEIIEKVIRPVIPAQFLDGQVKYYINKTGRFVIGGPHGDSGLTGRKIIVDTYGGMGAHGGGCFSGKDPTKVDRSASYMARHIAKNIVAAGLADRCQIQIAYVIGVAEPVSVMVDTFGTGKVLDEKLTEIVRKVFPLTPKGIIEYLQLRRPIYRKTAAYGHFGRNDPDFSWEKTGKAEELRKEAGIAMKA